jgi:hypothetical protein
MKTRHILNLTLIVMLAALAACSTSVSDDAGSQAFPYVRLSPSAPPQSPYEARPLPTEPMRQIWRAGYWDYDGIAFYWVPGYYMYRPDPTAAWTPDRWEQRAFGWAFVPGYWQ